MSWLGNLISSIDSNGNERESVVVEVERSIEVGYLFGTDEPYAYESEQAVTVTVWTGKSEKERKS